MVETISAEDLWSLIQSDADLTVVDIRAPSTYRDGHIPGAVNLPMDELPDGIAAVDWSAEEIVVACPIGQASIQAARLLESYEGINAGTVRSLEGGYQEWEYALDSGEQT